MKCCKSKRRSLRDEKQRTSKGNSNTEILSFAQNDGVGWVTALVGLRRWLGYGVGWSDGEWVGLGQLRFDLCL